MTFHIALTKGMTFRLRKKDVPPLYFVPPIALGWLEIAHSREEGTKEISEDDSRKLSALNGKLSRPKGFVKSSPSAPPLSILKGDIWGRLSNGEYMNSEY